MARCRPGGARLAATLGRRPEDFGATADSSTVALDVRPYLAAKRRALLCHPPRLADGHLFRVPRTDLCRGVHRREWLVRARRARRVGRMGPDPRQAGGVPW